MWSPGNQWLGSSASFALGRDVRIRLPGGELSINVAEDLSSVRMTGPAVRVFRGELEE
mgnify:CR=1 FL=1